ncbi:hypothetical protein GCM10025792_53730 [Pseudonocardia tropica]
MGWSCALTWNLLDVPSLIDIPHDSTRPPNAGRIPVRSGLCGRAAQTLAGAVTRSGHPGQSPRREALTSISGYRP